MEVTKSRALLTLPLRYGSYAFLSLGLGLLLASLLVETSRTIDFELVLGSIFFLLGLFLMSRMYRRREGVPLLSHGAVIFLDWAVILIMAVLAFMGLDMFLAQYSGGSPLLGREQEGMLGVISFVLVLLIMPLVVSWQASSSILVNGDGVVESGLIFRAFLPWHELERLELLEDVEFSGRHKSYKVLFLYDGEDNCVTVSGNMRRPAKEEICRKLMEHVPQERSHQMKMHLSSL